MKKANPIRENGTISAEGALISQRYVGTTPISGTLNMNAPATTAEKAAVFRANFPLIELIPSLTIPFLPVSLMKRETETEGTRAINPHTTKKVLQ
ncbi:MAG: hypothetical protein QXO03_05585 [Thermoplasmatales archaeon]